jgi:hypothetical protein
MASADVGKVPGEQKTILGSLNNLFNACMPLANTPGAGWLNSDVNGLVVLL